MNKILTNSRAKTFINSAIFVFALFACVSVFAQGKTVKKKPAPTPETPTYAIKVAQIDDAKLKELVKPNGKPLLVNFWATWCDPCREEFPDLVKIENDYRGKIDVITVSLDDITDINTAVPKFLTEMKAEMPTYLLVSKDEGAIISTISKDWNGGLPFTILYNEKGETIYFKQGKFKVPELREKIIETLNPQTALEIEPQQILSNVTPQLFVPLPAFAYFKKESGKTDAQNDISHGKLIIKTSGLIIQSRKRQKYLNKYGVEIYSTGCIAQEGFHEYARSYNEVTFAEIKRRFGEKALKELGLN